MIDLCQPVKLPRELISCVAAGQTCCLGTAFFWAWMLSYRVDGEVWEIGNGGKEPSVSLYFQWSAALGSSLSELVLGTYVSPQLRAWARKGQDAQVLRADFMVAGG